MSEVRAMSMYLADALAGMREIETITEISLSDNGGGEAIFNTKGQLIGFRTYEGGYTLSTTVAVVKDDPSEPDYWHLRDTRERVNVTVDFQGGDRVQFVGVLAKIDTKGDNQSSITASVEWILGKPKLLRSGTGRSWNGRPR